MSDNNIIQYQVVAARRLEVNTLMWQVPTLSIAAQAFLLSIALDADSSGFAAFMAAVLALIASLFSIQLMLRHRFFELCDSKWLEDVEQSHDDMDPIHAKPEDPKGKGFLARIEAYPSHKLWLVMLAFFAIAAVIILLEMAVR